MNFVIFSIINYLVGSISWALVIGKLFYKTDVREFGSKNLGATNVGRTLGKIPAIIVAVLDALKGFFCYIIEVNIDPIAAILTVIFAAIGHCYPIFAQFKGGKAVATSFGILLALSISSYKEFILIFLIPLLIWLMIKKFTSLVSLASLIALFISALLSLICLNYYKSIVIFILFIFVSYRHKDDIKRLLAGKETKSNY